MRQPIDRTLRLSLNNHLCEYLGLETEDRKNSASKRAIPSLELQLEATVTFAGLRTHQCDVWVTEQTDSLVPHSKLFEYSFQVI